MKILVIHPDKQHSILTAEAIYNSKNEIFYFTQIYNDNSLFIKIISFIFPSLLKKFKKNVSTIPIRYIKYNNIIGLLRQIFLRSNIDFFVFLSKILNKIWFNTVFKLVKQLRPDAIISYDFNSYFLYKKIIDSKIKVLRILDLTAPQYDFFLDNLTLNSGRKYDFNKFEKYSIFDKKQSDISIFEIKNADTILVASKLSKESITKLNFPEKKVEIIRYGKDFFGSHNLNTIHYSKLSVLFMGKFTDAKGFNLYLDFVNKFPNSYNYYAIGKFDSQSLYYNQFKNTITFTGFLEKDQLKAFLPKIDFLFFFSFCDGFGFTVLECMQNGIIPIVSKHAGISDIISHGFNGFVIDPNSLSLIHSLILKLNSEQISLLKFNSFQTSKLFDTHHYELAINAFINKL